MEEVPETPNQTDEEDAPDDFLCCICLDLLYKPVVLACGHMACFWCVHVSMSGLGDSHCPICRNSYKYFPSICQTLHFMLMKLYPIAYKKREDQILSEETESKRFSPQLHKSETGSSVLNDQGKTSNEECEDAISGVKTANEHKKELSIADVACIACGQLLYRPVVLNCGHAFCACCIPNRVSDALKCTNCEGLHPSSSLKVCLEFDQFLETRFSSEYSARRETCPMLHQDVNLSGEGKGQPSSPTQTGESTSGNLPHIGVGCDSCGMYPIIGERYRCRDCEEAMGFDFCGGCYRRRSMLPGRFNQRHTPDHTFERIDGLKPFSIFTRPYY